MDIVIPGQTFVTQQREGETVRLVSTEVLRLQGQVDRLSAALRAAGVSEELVDAIREGE